MSRIIEAKILSSFFTKSITPLKGSVPTTPRYATPGAAGMDVCACLGHPVEIPPGEHRMIPTGLALNMQDSGLVAILASRSGLANKHQVVVLNGIGVIDSDYTGEIKVLLINHGTQPYTVMPGERVAQLMFQPVVQVELKYVQDFDATTERGADGFGSTGKF